MEEHGGVEVEDGDHHEQRGGSQQRSNNGSQKCADLPRGFGNLSRRCDTGIGQYPFFSFLFLFFLLFFLA